MPLDTLGMILECTLQLFQVCHFMCNSDLRGGGGVLSLSTSWWVGVCTHACTCVCACTCMCVCVLHQCWFMFSFLFSGSEFLLPLNELRSRIALPSCPVLPVCTAASHPKPPFHWISLAPRITPAQCLCEWKPWHHRAASSCLGARHLLHPKLPPSSPPYHSRFP